MKELIEIQSELKCPKGSYNAFGKYRYRSAEQILEAVKPLLYKHECFLLLSDEMVEVGGKIFLKATVKLIKEGSFVEVHGYAETGEHKGMSSEQSTGTASSYARKYALNGLFLIDETEADPDSLKKEITKPKLSKGTADWTNAVEKLSSGKVDLAKIESVYQLSEEAKVELLKMVKK